MTKTLETNSEFYPPPPPNTHTHTHTHRVKRPSVTLQKLNIFRPYISKRSSD